MIPDRAPAHRCLIATNQHTGTWVMINFVRNVIGLPVSMYGADGEEAEKSAFMHIHFATWRWWATQTQRPKPAHVSASDSQVDRFVDERKTVITMRDPVLSLITRHNRHPGWGHKYIIEGFLQMIRLARHPNVFLFPVDAWDEGQRFRSLCYLAHEFFSQPIVPTDRVKKFAHDWDTPNATADLSRLRAKYMAGDFRSVRRAMPGETALLLDHKDELMPFFEQNGYKRLPWFAE